MTQHNTHTEERAITIKVLRIGTKQLTRAIFRQLPQEHPINKETGQLKGKLWGHVLISDRRVPYILWEKEGALFSYRIDRIERESPYPHMLPALAQNTPLIQLYNSLHKWKIILLISDEGKLQSKGPREAMTPDIVEAIREHRQAIKETLPYVKAYEAAWQDSYNLIVGTEQLFIGG